VVKYAKNDFFSIQRTQFDNISTLVHKLGIILSKMRKFRIFQIFFTQMTVYDFLKQQKSTKFDMGFRMVHKL
jgi:hypothetical protein